MNIKLETWLASYNVKQMPKNKYILSTIAMDH